MKTLHSIICIIAFLGFVRTGYAQDTLQTREKSEDFREHVVNILMQKQGTHTLNRGIPSYSREEIASQLLRKLQNKGETSSFQSLSLPTTLPNAQELQKLLGQPQATYAPLTPSSKQVILQKMKSFKKK